MSAVTQTNRRGHKHRCGACGTAFYDLERELSACPKCETPYAAAEHMPRGEAARKRSWSKRTRRPEPDAGPETSAAEAREEDNESVPILDAEDDAEQAEEAEEAEEADEATENDDP